MAIDMTENELKAFKEMLAQYVKYLKYTNQMPLDKPTDEIVDSIVHTIKNDDDNTLNADKLSEDNTKSELRLICRAEGHPNNKEFLHDLLLKRNPEKSDKEFNEQLKVVFKDMLKLTPAFNALKPEDQQKRLADADNLAEKCSHEFERNPNSTLALKMVMGLLAGCRTMKKLSPKDRENLCASMSKDEAREQLRELQRDMTGTAELGGIQIPVDYQPGNLAGVADFLTFGDSFLGTVNNPDPTVQDPTGIKMFTILNKIAEGGLSEGLENALINDGLLPNTKNSAPNPFCSNPSPKY